MPDSMPNPDAPTLLFMHIPKTAGTSIRHALGACYVADERLYLYDSASLPGAVHPKDFASLPESRRARLRLVLGHFRFGLHQHIPRESRYLTIIRDPVERVASHYFHYRSLVRPQDRTRAAGERQLIAEQGLSLEDWVFGLERLEADNWMVRTIAGRYGVPFGATPDDLLAEALRNIDEHFALVFAVERLDLAPAQLSRVTGVGMGNVPRVNANLKRVPLGELDQVTIARLRALNRLDLELHRVILERIDASL